MSAARRKGTTWETAIVTLLRACGWRHVERRALAGARDRGDIAGIPGVVIEAKAAKEIRLAEWMRELEVEVANDNADLGFVWIKKRGRTSAWDGYIVMTPRDVIALLTASGYGPGGQ